VPVDQSGFDKDLVFTQAVEWELVVFVFGDAVEHVRFILDFDRLENRLTQVIANGVTMLAHGIPLLVGLDGATYSNEITAYARQPLTGRNAGLTAAVDGGYAAAKTAVQ